MATTERYTTVVELNSKQAKDELNELIRLEEDLRKKRDQVNRSQDPKQYSELTRQIRQVSKEAKAYGKDVMQTINTLNNLSTASEKEIRQAIRSLEKMQQLVPRNSNLYNGLSERLSLARQELEKMAVEQNKNNIAINLYQKELDTAQKSQLQVMRERQLINATMQNLSKANVRDLEASLAVMKEQLRTQERGSAEYRRTQQRIKQVKTELERVNAEQQKTVSLGSRISAVFNKWQGAFIMLTSSLIQTRMTVEKAIQSYASMEEEMANVRKYTGLADEEVRRLNEDFKGMDTRTPREKLNQLAGDAGRLGLQTREAVKDFVEGANMINVALGDDLGEDAVKNVGKLAMAFGEDEKRGLRGAMLATGSAVNELAQNSSAGAGYLIDYTARVAGFAKQLGLTQAQLMGYGAVMDENLLRDEMAATAFGNMLTKMQTDTEKFAAIAGMSVEKFTKLVAEDANEAVLQLAENLKRQDGKTMMKMLDDMGLDGARAVSVLATLADKVDDVRERQKLATKAYEEGISVVKEYNTMNATVQAQLDKAKDRFNDLRVELGERLMPVMVNGLHVASSVIEILKSLLDFSSRNAKVLIYLATVITTYVAVQKVREMWDKRVLLITKAQAAADAMANGLIKARTGLLGILKTAQLAYSQVLAETTGNMKRAAAANRALNATVASNPWGAALVALVAFVGGVALAVDKIDELTNAERRLNDVNNQVSDNIGEEQRHIETLTDVIRSNVSTEEERKRALEELNGKLMDKHLGNITEEAVRTGQATQVLERYLELKTKELKMRALEEEITKSQMSLDESNRAIENLNSGNPLKMWRAMDMEDILFGGLLGAKGLALTRNKINAYTERQNLETLKKELQAMVEGVPGTGGQIITRKDPRHSPLSPPQTGYTSEAERKKKEEEDRKQDEERKRQLRERNEAIKAANDELLAMNMASYAAGEINYRDYLKKEQQLQLAGIRKRMELYGEGTDEYKKLQLKEQQLLRRGTEEQQQLELHDMEHQHRDLIEQLKQDFEDRNSSIYQNETALNEALFQADYDYLQLKAELYNKGSLERMQVEEETEELLRQHQLEREQYYQESLESLRETYLGQSSEKRKTLELNALDELFRQGLIKEEEYQQARLQIQARYAQDSTAGSVSGGTASAAFKVARQQAGDANAQNPWTGDLTNLQNQTAALKEMYQNDELTHAEYLAAKAMAIDEFLQNTQEKYGAVFEQLGGLYNAANAYAKASSDYETVMITKKYDAEIEKAGNNQAKVKKLEEKKQKEIAAVKKKANDRAMKMEIAQALASTAMGAINAYTSAAEVPLVGYLLAPVAAAAAIAAGMLQVATIRKQHQAEAAGYYEGGYTGGRDYRKKAGVVHEGEFVANHQAVNNPAIVPFLDFIDRAQKNNTVGSLTMDDVRRTVAGSSSASVIAPVVNVQTDNEELRDALEAHRMATASLLERLSRPINAQVVLTGPDGLNAQQERLNNMLKNT